MANNLSEVGICRAPQGMWEDKVHQDAFGVRDGIGLKTFGIMDGLGKVDVWDRVCGKRSSKLHRGCSTETGGELMREKRIGFAKKANVFV